MFTKTALSFLMCSALITARAQNTDNYPPATSPDQQQAAQQPANEFYRPTMELGINGGAGPSILYNQHPLQNPRTPNKAPYTSTSFGISYQYNFPKIFSIRAELNMERKGDDMYLSQSTTTGAEGQTITTTNAGLDKFNYVTLPVMCRISYGKRVQLIGDVGFYAGLLMNAERITSSSYIASPGAGVTEVSNDLNTTQGLHQFDGGFVTGLGFLVPIWKAISFSVEARNYLGLANINANNTYYGNKLYNNTTNVLFGLNFSLADAAKSSDRLPNLK
jgi:hypothetical protein